MSGRPGGVIGAFAFSAFSVSVAATFVLLPQAFAVTWPWVAAIALFGYGPEVRDWLPWVWWIVLALSVYGLTRLGLYLVFALITLILALGLLGRRR